MASSSHKRHENQYPLEEVSNDLGKKVRGREWLDLGLGLDFSHGFKKQANSQSYPISVSVSKSTALACPPSPFLIHQDREQIELGLGLGLGKGFDHEGVRSINVASHGDNHSTLWKGQDRDQDKDYYDHDYHDMQLCPRQMDSSNLLDWQMTSFTDSNHYSTRRRAHPGLWFTLLSSTNRFGATLPQIPKAYIRVKDENMTVSTVKKYLVRKLGLSNEAEIDISCMGQNLVQSLTLKQVQDAVWLPRLIQSVSSTTVVFQNPQDMSMPLHYGRRCLLDSTS